MSRLINVCLTILCCIHAASAQAQRPDRVWRGNLLYKYCKSATRPEVGLCIGFISGITNTLRFMSLGDCLPKGNPYVLTSAVTKYMDTHLEKLHEPAFYLVMSAFSQQRWVCRKKKKQ